MKRPKFIGLFPCQFPGWGGDDAPVYHHKLVETKDHGYVQAKDRDEKPCDMAFHPPSGGPCMSSRYSSSGVAGIDAAGNCWVLARDLAIPGYGGGAGLVWVKFPVEVAP